MTRVYRITDTSNDHVIDILKRGLSTAEDEPKTIENYHPDYSSHNANLFYILANGRFANGAYFVITDDQDNYMGSQGWHPYSDSIALIGSRGYVAPGSRFHYILAKEATPRSIRESWSYAEQWITFNEHNFTYYKGFSRDKWKDHELYKYFETAGKANVYNTDQWVIRLNKERYENAGLI